MKLLNILLSEEDLQIFRLFNMINLLSQEKCAVFRYQLATINIRSAYDIRRNIRAC